MATKSILPILPTSSFPTYPKNSAMPTSSLISNTHLSQSGNYVIMGAAQHLMSHQLMSSKTTRQVSMENDQPTGLCKIDMVQITKLITPKASFSYNTTPLTTLQDHLQFHHAACFSPTTLLHLQAIRNNQFTTWQRSSTTNIWKYLPMSSFTAKDLLDQQCMNLKSIKQCNELAEDALIDWMHQVFSSCLVIVTLTSLIHTYLAERFPVQLILGNKYLLVLYNYDSNAIIMEAIHMWNASDIYAAYANLIQFLQCCGSFHTCTTLTMNPHTCIKSFLHNKNRIPTHSTEDASMKCCRACNQNF